LRDNLPIALQSSADKNTIIPAVKELSSKFEHDYLEAMRKSDQWSSVLAEFSQRESFLVANYILHWNARTHQYEMCLLTVATSPQIQAKVTVLSQHDLFDGGPDMQLLGKTEKILPLINPLNVQLSEHFRHFMKLGDRWKSDFSVDEAVPLAAELVAIGHKQEPDFIGISMDVCVLSEHGAQMMFQNKDATDVMNQAGDQALEPRQ
jgi:hypothetical protein